MWALFGEGIYNYVYISNDRQRIFKWQKKEYHVTDTPERSVRLWNEINPHIYPPAKISIQNLPGVGMARGWICPYIEGRQSTDQEISAALIRIFNNTGRIIVDAVSPGNFLTTAEGQVVCVDVGVALQMEKGESLYRLKTSRRPSIISLDTWQELCSPFGKYFQQGFKVSPIATDIVKALLFIKKHSPDISNANFLKNNPEVLRILSGAYTYEHRHQFADEMKGEEDLFELAKETLEAVCPRSSSDPLNNKFACLWELYMPPRRLDENLKPSFFKERKQRQALLMDELQARTLLQLDRFDRDENILPSDIKKNR